MSLAQHVTQVDGFDYECPANPSSNGNLNGNDSTANEQCLGVGEDADRSEWRHMSFAPVEIAQDETHIAAYKVSNSKRYAQAATAVIACWLASGIVFGFAALKSVLIAEGVYHELCRNDETTGFDDESSLDVPCAEQDMRLNLFFISASITTNISSLFAGTALDRFGRRACWRASCVFLVVGPLLMGSSFAIPEFDGYLLGNVFLALGGTFLFVPSFQLANVFPKHSGLVVALITGAFDASAAVFLFYRMAYDASGGKFSLEKFFFGYLIVPVLIFFAEIFLMPSHAYHTMPELKRKIEKVQDRTRDVHDSDEDISDAGELMRVRSARANKRKAKLEKIEELAGSNEHREERIKIEEERQEASGVWGVLHGVPAHQQMLSPWFILILLLTVFQILRMNYFIASIRAQYRYMLESEIAAGEINEFFDVALPLGGVASTPFIGLLLNNLSVPPTFGVLTLFITVIGTLNCLPFLWAGYATVVAFVLFRPLYYSAISDYATKVFGFATFGRIYGTIVCLSGMVNFVQSGLDALTHGPLHGNPTPINATLGALGGIIGVTLTIFVRIRGRVFVDEKAELDAGQERQRLLFDAHEGYGARN
ncbi:major facilitator superfamily domain-containing protein [Ilyonectria robusta]|uniref:major facilitator superfamily domain-containing protein n=1 Tax=Ilyonectria robusta TaxID=1079257 RepID=UPI001E8E6D32|nr:major facilitator superfamily domain-containing protein [Ilyonectria robusta]KAH8654773.1 major facilitator superfamily domain-containing protein [Ilyonectria robusta]